MIYIQYLTKIIELTHSTIFYLKLYKQNWTTTIELSDYTYAYIVSLTYSIMWVWSSRIIFYNFLIWHVHIKFNHNKWIASFYNVLIYYFKLHLVLTGRSLLEDRIIISIKHNIFGIYNFVFKSIIWFTYNIWQNNWTNTFQNILLTNVQTKLNRNNWIVRLYKFVYIFIVVL